VYHVHAGEVQRVEMSDDDDDLPSVEQLLKNRTKRSKMHPSSNDKIGSFFGKSKLIYIIATINNGS
jgi:hypothetical protein